MKYNITLKIILSFFCIGFIANAFAQITIDNSKTPDKLVTDVLIPASSGTVISNVQYKGVYSNSSKSQFGTFVASGSTKTAMGFSDGLVLISGYSSDIPGSSSTDMSNSWTSCSVCGCNGEVRSTGTCPTLVNDVKALVGAGGKYLNAAILEFDFIPVSTNVQFNYIFGSEEYPTFDCSEYNDKFGFLLSGPGISGGEGFENDAKNIARLSNGSVVSINSVNNGQVGTDLGNPNANNCKAANKDWVLNVPTADFLGVIPGIKFNGNTKLLMASQTGLVPGQTYHIKLIVTDVSDGAFDSGVFLEAGSFTTEPTGTFAGIDQSVCSDTTTLQAFSPLTGSWSVILGSASVTDLNLPKSKVSGLSLGENKFVWTSAEDPTKSDTVTVTYSNTPSSISYTPSTISNGSSTKVSVSVTGSVSGSYTSTPSGLTINSSTGEITPNTSDPGTYKVEVNSSCGKISTEVIVTSSTCGKVGFNGYKNGAPYNLPTTFTCSDNTDFGMRADDQLKAGEYIAPGFTIKYDQDVSFSSTTIEINENNTGFVNTMASKVVTYCVPTYEYQVKLTGVSGSGNVWIEDHATGAKYLITPASTNMTIIIPIGSIKGSSVFSGAGVSNVKINKVSTYAGSGYGVFNPSKAGAGKHTIYYNWDNGAGCAGVDSIVVTVAGVSTPPLINPDTLVFCTSQNLKVDTLTKIFDPSFIWYDASVGGIPLDVASDLLKDKMYYASQKVGGCESGQRDSVYVIISSSNPPVLSSDTVRFCLVEQKKLSDITTESGIKWYDAAIGGNLLPDNTVLDSVWYYASQVIGACESIERDSVFAKLFDTEKPTLKDPSYANLSFCTFPVPILDTLKNFINEFDLNWYLDSIGGSPLSPSDRLLDTTYFVSQHPEGKCESFHRLKIVVSLTDTLAPDLNNGDTLKFCPTENATIAQLDSLFPSMRNLNWYDVSAGGTALARTTILNSAMYYASQIGLSCESSLRDSVYVLLKSPDAPDANSSLVLCAANSPTEAELMPNGNDIKWYLSQTGLDTVNGEDFLVDGRIYYASQKRGACESTDRLAVTVTLEDPAAPSISSKSNSVVCSGDTASILANNPVSGISYKVYSSPSDTVSIGQAPYKFVPTANVVYYVEAITSNGCAQTAARVPVSITVNPNPLQAKVSATGVLVCAKDSIILMATSTQSNILFNWTGPNSYSSKSQPQTTQVTALADSVHAGTYYVTAVDKNTGCNSKKRDSVVVNVKTVKAGFVPNVSFGFIPVKVEFTNTSINGLTYFWNFQDSATATDKDPKHVFKKDGEYKVYLVAYNGTCKDTAYSAMIDVDKASKLEIPNVFTPNDDNVNDVFNLKGDGLKTISAKIYNRWGQLVYEWETINGGWNGVTLSGINAPDGTYFYVINASGNDGVPYTLKGDVNLIR